MLEGIIHIDNANANDSHVDYRMHFGVDKDIAEGDVLPAIGSGAGYYVLLCTAAVSGFISIGP